MLHARVLADHGGGPDKTILRSMPYLKKAGYRAAVAYIHPPEHPGLDTIRHHARRHKAAVFSIPDRGALDATSAFRLLRLCRDLKVRIWHAHDYKSEALGLFVQRFLPITLVSTLHGYVHADRKAQFLYEIGRKCLRFYDHVIVVSPDLAESARKAAVTTERLTYIPNAIELDEFTRTVSTTEAQVARGWDATRQHLGIIARLSGEKRIDRAIASLYQLARSDINAHLHVVGDGPIRDELHTQAHTLGVADRVTFHGWVKDVRSLIQALDLVILTSTIEGLPNALLEAMALEVPVAATPVGGISDLLDEGNAGLLLDGHSETWAPALATLLSDEQQLARLAQHGRQRIEQHFSFAHRMQRVIEIYNSLINPQKLKLAA